MHLYVETSVGGYPNLDDGNCKHLSKSSLLKGRPNSCVIAVRNRCCEHVVKSLSGGTKHLGFVNRIRSAMIVV